MIDFSNEANNSSGCSISGRLCFTLSLLVAFGMHTGVQAAGVEEASGITRLDDMLLVVGDKTPGAYYTYPLTETQEPLVTLDPALQTKIELPEGAVALDLEGIAVLVDGRVVVLSERLRALVGAKGIIAEYGTPLTEFGNRGLEGVAVLPDGQGASRVAVLWEGGYPEYDQMPEELRRIVGRPALRPVIWVHTIAREEAKLHVWSPPVHSIELQVPVPDQADPPNGQRFRAPDLVWHRWKSQSQDELGFIVLLSSENSPVSRKREFRRYQWLQRFTLDGKPYGEPLDLAAILPEDLRDRNWEGLGWHIPNEKLIIVHDAPPYGVPSAYILAIPNTWH